MPPRKSRATSFEVARLAGVSQPSVSRAFTPGASISKEKRDKVLAAAKELNYVPNVFASSLSSARSNMVAVVSGSLSNPFYSESLQVFIEQFQNAGRQVLAFSVEANRDCDEALMQAMRYPVDGIVVTSASMSSEVVRMSEGLGIPIVMYNRRVVGSNLANVRCDHEDGSARIGRFMHAAGARSFLIVRGDPQGSSSGDRERGFREAVERLGTRGIEDLAGGSSYSGARNAMIRYFGGPAPHFPDAIFAVNDIMAIACADVLREIHGLRIPEDIVVVGFDDVAMAAAASFRLTTLRQDVEGLAAETVDRLVERMADPARPARAQTLPVQLIVRDTTAR